MAIQVSGSTVIHDSQDVQVSGMFTASSFVGDASQLTNLPASGGTLEATASGTLADGEPVIVNVDGTVSAITQTVSGFLLAFGGSEQDISHAKVAFDSSGNFYVAGYTTTGTDGFYDFLIVKFNSSGTLQWSRKFGCTGTHDTSHGIVVDSSGNSYIVGGTGSGPYGSSDILIVKYNTSGTLQWKQVLGGTDHDIGQGGIAIDSSGNLYIGNYTKSSGSGNYDLHTAKLNSSGTVQWKRTLGGTGMDFNEAGIAVDSSGNAYITGNTNSTGSGGYDAVIAKYNSSGTLQWQRTLGGGSNDYSYGEPAVDSSGNFYIVGYTQSGGAGGNDILIAKYNSSGTLQWSRTLGGSNSDIGYSITVDSSDNVYITGYTDESVSPQISMNTIIAKYNSSGDIQWQRTLGSSTSTQEYGYGIQSDNSGNIYVTMQQSTISPGGGLDILIAKLPDDGSLTGTHGPYIYAESSLSSAAISLTSSSSSLTDASSSLNSGGSLSGFVDSASSLSSSITDVTSTSLTAENFIGISNGAYSNGQTATVQVTGSVDDAQSGLTAGQAYYVQDNGTLGESGSVFAGTAVSASKIIVKG